MARLLAVVALALGVLGTGSSAGAGEGMEVLCDRADYGCTEGTGYRGQGVWGANHFRTGHNCTSYVSYRLAQLGVAQPWRPMGNANRWDDNARGRVAVDDVPAVGAIAQWEGGTRLAPGALGHVAYVEAVTADGIELTDDTSAGRTRRYRITRGSPYWPDDFVHIHDLAPSNELTAGTFALTNAERPPLADAVALELGTARDVPVVGDWDGDGDDTIGVFRNGIWTLARSHRDGELAVQQVRFGQAGDVPVVGDWDGDGDDTVGIYRNGTWFLANGSSTAPPATLFAQLGGAGDVPVVGDWDGDGDASIGVFREGRWTLADLGPEGPRRHVEAHFGSAGDRPVVGDWDGAPGDTLGVYRDGTWVLPAANDALDGELALLVLGTGDTRPLVGDWDGKGSDTLGVAR